MKYDWAKLVHEMRIRMMEMTTIEGQDHAHTMDLVGYFRMTMRDTDTFHPFHEDRYLDKAFAGLPERCNFRSVEAYWKYKNARQNVISWMYDYFVQMETLIRDHFSNPMNFPPGYMPPKKVEFGDLEAHAEKSLPMTIRLIQVK
jgi:hypothetical protein